MAALEALSMGIPVIAADNRGTREYMSNALNGWLCAPQKLSEQMGEALKKLRAMPAAERGQLRKRCVISVWQYEKRHTHRPSDPVSGGAVHLFPDIFGLGADHGG